MLDIRHVRGMNKKSAKKNEWDDLAHVERSNAEKRNITNDTQAALRVRSIDGFESDFYWIKKTASRTKMREYTWLMRLGAGHFGFPAGD